MNIRIGLYSLLLIACLLGAHAAQMQLAGIKIGMKQDQVRALLGAPTAKIKPQQPVAGGAPAGLPGMPGGGERQAAASQENTLIFIYNGEEEVELATEVGIAYGKEVTGSNIPMWAYTVRVSKLALNQQQFIYRINDTYSIGVTFTGKGNESKVSDVIACSMKPLTVWPTRPDRKFDRNDAFFKDMFTYKYGATKEQRLLNLTGGTTKKVTIGSRLDDVLKAHKWPTFIIPFATEPTAVVTMGSKTTVDAAQGGAGNGGDVTLAIGSGGTLSSNFVNNCLLYYPDDNVILTLMNFVVVRIQIGSDLSKPNMTAFVPAGGAAHPVSPAGGASDRPVGGGADRPVGGASDRPVDYRDRPIDIRTPF